MSDSKWVTPKWSGLTEKLDVIKDITSNMIETEIKRSNEQLGKIKNVLEQYGNWKASAARIGKPAELSGGNNSDTTTDPANN
jgi:hypothetical protein